jgi:hypothetical protein
MPNSISMNTNLTKMLRDQKEVLLWDVPDSIDLWGLPTPPVVSESTVMSDCVVV